MTHSDCKAITPKAETASKRLTQIFETKEFKSVDLFGDEVKITFTDGTTVEFCLECHDWDSYRLAMHIDERGEWHELLSVGRKRL